MGAAADEEAAKARRDKLKEKKARQKQHKQQRRQELQRVRGQGEAAAADGGAAAAAPPSDDEEQVEYVSAPLPPDLLAAMAAGREADAAARAEAAARAAAAESAAAAGAGGAAAAAAAALAAEGEEGATVVVEAAGEDEATRAAAARAREAARALAEQGPYADLQAAFRRFLPAEVVTGAVPLLESEEEEEAARQQRERRQQEEEEGGAKGRRRRKKGGGKKQGKEEGAMSPSSSSSSASDSSSDSSDGDDEGARRAADGTAHLTKRERRALARRRVAELKRRCPRPEVVEAWDSTAPDPQLLVSLKSERNTVPVPRHWSQKRKYLFGKRGVEKPPFRLPEYLEATGITEMRNAYGEGEADKRLKQKSRERVSGRAGKLDIDYAVLHDAFFRHQTRPRSLTGFGDLYYEGKEYDAPPAAAASSRPGFLSQELRAALGLLPDGADPLPSTAAAAASGAPPPPPWLVAMQRYGPPPAYPALKIPGLNAPLPPGAKYGYHPGGWGKPPVDERGLPVYGDPFGTGGGEAGAGGNESEAEAAELRRGPRWGAMADEDGDGGSSDESSSGEEEGEDGAGAGAGGDDADVEVADDGGAAAAGLLLAEGAATGLQTGLTAALGGAASPSAVELRKQTGGGADSVAQPRQLYQVLEQRRAAVAPGQILGTDHVYVVPPAGAAGGGGGDAVAGGAASSAAAADGAASTAAGGAAAAARQRRLKDVLRAAGAAPSDVEVALDPDELEGLDPAAVRRLYEARVAEARELSGRGELSGMVGAQAAAQKRRLARQAEQRAAKKAKGGGAGGDDPDSFKF